MTAPHDDASRVTPATGAATGRESKTGGALRLAAVTFDTRDSAAELAAFWSAVLDSPLADGGTEQVAMVEPGKGFPALLFLQVPDRPAGKNRVHLDLVDPDYPQQVGRIVELGATQVGDFDEWGITWTTLADPEGNLFDVALPHS